MQKFDFKKALKDLYAPKQTPVRVFVPKMSFIAVRGEGNPNDSSGAYQEALKILYPTTEKSTTPPTSSAK